MSEFKKLAKDLLIERAAGTFSKCSTQCNIEKGLKAFQKLASFIKEEDLHEYGRENEPHITVLYGIKPGLTAFKSTKEAIDDSGIKEIKAVVGDCSLFKNKDFDVIKFEVISKDLHELNELLCNRVDYENDYSDYTPHITVAYVKPGLGQSYVEKIGNKFAGFPLSFDKVIFSDVDGTKKPIILGYSGNETAKHPNTGDYLKEDFGYGGSHLPGGVQGNAYMAGHMGVFNSPTVRQNPSKFRDYKRYSMNNNNTVVSSGYYDTVFDEDVRKIMSILKDLGISVEWPVNDEDDEYDVVFGRRHDQTHTQTSRADIGSSDDVLDNSSGINLSKEIISKYLRNHFGEKLEDKVKAASGKITYDRVIMGLKEEMRIMQYPDKDYATVKVLKKLIDSPTYYSGLEKYDINESIERNIYGTKFKPSAINKILKEMK